MKTKKEKLWNVFFNIFNIIAASYLLVIFLLYYDYSNYVTLYVLLCVLYILYCIFQLLYLFYIINKEKLNKILLNHKEKIKKAKSKKLENQISKIKNDLENGND